MTRAEMIDALCRSVSPFGVVNDLRGECLEDRGQSYFLYRARINAFGRTGLLTPPLSGFGFSGDKDDAVLKALCEALERFCGVNFEPRIRHRGPWSDVAPNAVDPRQCLGYLDEQYRIPGFSLAPFDPEADHDWVEAMDPVSKSTLWMHLDLALMSMTSKVSKTSSVGMAIHSDAGLAAESAVLELIERDHLALAFWYGAPCRSLPKDNLPLSLHPHLESMVQAGYELHCLGLNFGLDVPVVLWLAFRADGLPHLLKGASANRRGVDAQSKAFEEMFRSFLHYRRHPFEVSSNAQGAMKNLVHYQTPDVAKRLGFLIDQTSRADPPELGGDFQGDLFTHLMRKGFPTYLVDMSHSVIGAFGLTCIRAISPSLVKTPLGSEPWQLASPRLRAYRGARDEALAAHPELHFFS
ncbi:YcaO-like family protein [Thiomonas bhubaneswarensis]|uniref:YcaO-like family n=1 Tax=Thiomonas bhubaneswarensis TaxID=339866 RepID=A0A0K6I059_9BURK|nr:YcaO-like family protein [Thiomonas bhubaneswarensis]CUA96544.1 YcaO-like family [Thiomonas bhubaneswarensis]